MGTQNHIIGEYFREQMRALDRLLERLGPNPTGGPVQKGKVGGIATPRSKEGLGNRQISEVPACLGL
ncbi:MAG: hypothetical protein ACK4WB_09755, partial [Desulfatiglandales bacterium]